MKSTPCGILLLRVTVTIFYASAITAADNAGRANATEIIIGNRTVINAWQSSTLNRKFCFKGRSAQTEDALAKDRFQSSMYFHSNNKFSASNGYHWLVLQLNASQYVTAVSVKCTNNTMPPFTYNRAADIEIWTSVHGVNLTGADHCSAHNLSLYFRNFKYSWKLCGVTKPRHGGNVTMGEILSVNCKAKVKMLLLRRPTKTQLATGRHDDGRGFMSFAGITLTARELPMDRDIVYNKSVQWVTRKMDQQGNKDADSNKSVVATSFWVISALVVSAVVITASIVFVLTRRILHGFLCPSLQQRDLNASVATGNKSVKVSNEYVS